MKSTSRYFRLLPAVVLVAGGLLVMKSVTLVGVARAQTAMTGQAPAPEPKDTTNVAVTDPVIDDSEANSAAEVDVLTSLSKRRQQLDAREQSLNMQANLIAAAEKRVDGKIDMLKNLQAQMQTLLGQRDAAAQKQLNDLVKSYSAMKPADAARIFNSLDDTVELDVAAQMKSDVLGAILAKMQPDAAQRLTVRLANRLNPPAPAAVAAATAPEPPAAQQMAAVDPAAQTQSPAAPGAAPATPVSAPNNSAGSAAQPATESAPAAKQAATTPPPPAPAPKQAQVTPPAPKPAQQKQAQANTTQAKPQPPQAKPDSKQQASATPAKAEPAQAPAKAKNG